MAETTADALADTVAAGYRFDGPALELGGLMLDPPNDAKALKQTVNTYPTSSYDDLGQVILSLGIGEAIVTVMNERGAPTPVAWTRLRAPESLMGPADPAAMVASVDASPLKPKYGEAIDRESAREKLAAKLEAGAAQ